MMQPHHGVTAPGRAIAVRLRDLALRRAVELIQERKAAEEKRSDKS